MKTLKSIVDIFNYVVIFFFIYLAVICVDVIDENHRAQFEGVIYECNCSEYYQENRERLQLMHDPHFAPMGRRGEKLIIFIYVLEQISLTYLFYKIYKAIYCNFFDVKELNSNEPLSNKE
jgi:hypothetical protein